MKCAFCRSRPASVHGFRTVTMGTISICKRCHHDATKKRPPWRKRKVELKRDSTQLVFPFMTEAASDGNADGLQVS